MKRAVETGKINKSCHSGNQLSDPGRKSRPFDPHIHRSHEKVIEDHICNAAAYGKNKSCDRLSGSDEKGLE